jgi:hypothetical protein
VASPLPADFEGEPQEFFQALIERMEIQSPVGTNFFLVGDVEPSTDQGPWLKGGDRWYVFDQDEGKYVPIDILDSLPQFFTISSTEPDAPVGNEAVVWLRTSGTRAIGWYFWTGSEWRPGGNVSPAGPTLSRPTTPEDLEQFWDTDINALIQWERGDWRTVSGTPNDIKFVTTALLQDALDQNPGWVYAADNDQDWRGAVIGIANKDPGASPVNAFTVNSGITSRAQADYVGSETHVLASGEIESHTHLVGRAKLLNSNNDAFFMRVDDGKELLIPGVKPPNHFEVKGDGGANGTLSGEMPAPVAGVTFVTSRQLDISETDYTSAASPHNTMQPTVFLWALRKT